MYNFINKELPVHVHGHAVLEVLLDPWVPSLQCYKQGLGFNAPNPLKIWSYACQICILSKYEVLLVIHKKQFESKTVCSRIPIHILGYYKNKIEIEEM